MKRAPREPYAENMRRAMLLCLIYLVAGTPPAAAQLRSWLCPQPATVYRQQQQTAASWNEWAVNVARRIEQLEQRRIPQVDPQINERVTSLEHELYRLPSPERIKSDAAAAAEVAARRTAGQTAKTTAKDVANSSKGELWQSAKEIALSTAIKYGAASGTLPGLAIAGVSYLVLRRTRRRQDTPAGPEEEPARPFRPAAATDQEETAAQ